MPNISIPHLHYPLHLNIHRLPFKLGVGVGVIGIGVLYKSFVDFICYIIDNLIPSITTRPEGDSTNKSGKFVNSTKISKNNINFRPFGSNDKSNNGRGTGGGKGNGGGRDKSSPRKEFNNYVNLVQLLLNMLQDIGLTRNHLILEQNNVDFVLNLPSYISRIRFLTNYVTTTYPELEMNLYTMQFILESLRNSGMPDHMGHTVIRMTPANRASVLADLENVYACILSIITRICPNFDGHLH